MSVVTLEGPTGREPVPSRVVKPGRPATALVRSVAMAWVFAGPWFSLSVALGDIRKPDRTPVDPDRLSALLDDRREPLRVRVTNAGMRPTELPQAPGPGNPSVGSRFEFLDAFTCGMTHDADGGTYYLLIEIFPRSNRVRDVLGWVHSRYLLTTTRAEEDPASKLSKKAMVVNSIDNIADDARRIKDDPTTRFGAVAPRLGPSASAAPSGEEIRLFNLFFIYGQANDYVLLGNALEFKNNDEDPKRVIVGWLPRDRVTPWLTRESLYWAPGESPRFRDTPGVVYASARDAAASTRGRPAQAVTSERPVPNRSGVYGRTLTPQQMRFPLLRGSDPSDTTPLKLNNNEMLRVGAFGDFVSGTGPQAREVRKTDEELAAIQRNIADVRREMKRVELVFVIDETSSIKKGGWYPVIAETINRILAPLRALGTRGQGPEVRIAVSYYGDTFGGSEAATPARLVGAADFEPILRGLPNHRGQDFPDDDALERVFYGLGQALDSAGFSKLSRKMVILFGDFGNKEIEGDPSAVDLIDKLVPTNVAISPIEFYAVQVGQADKYSEGIKFRDEMSNLSNRVAERIKGRPGADATAPSLSAFVNVTSPRDAEPVIESIVQRYTKLREKALKAGDELDSIRLTFGNSISPETESALIARGVKIDELRKMPGAQLFQPGFVWRKNSKGVNQVREYLLASGGELDRFLKRTAGLDLLPGQAGFVTNEEFIRKMVEVMGGEMSSIDRKRPLNEVVRQATGFTFRNELFDREIEDITKAKLNNQELADIRWKRSVLADVLAGQKCEYVAQEVPGGGGFAWTEHVKSTKAAKYDSRGFYFPGDDSIKWYWIDFEEEWP